MENENLTSDKTIIKAKRGRKPTIKAIDKPIIEKEIFIIIIEVGRHFIEL
jgi:hypothetical protein